MKQLFTTIAFVAVFAAGVAAGHYHGVAITLERFVLVSQEAIGSAQ